MFVRTTYIQCVSTRIRVPHWVVAHVRIPVKVLRIPRLGHNRIRADEAANSTVVEAGVVVVEAKVLGALPGFLPDRGSNHGQHKAPDYQCCR